MTHSLLVNARRGSARRGVTIRAGRGGAAFGVGVWGTNLNRYDLLASDLKFDEDDDNELRGR